MFLLLYFFLHARDAVVKMVTRQDRCGVDDVLCSWNETE